MSCPGSATAGEKEIRQNLVFTNHQVDSVLSADGRRPVRRALVYTTREGSVPAPSTPFPERV